MLYIQIQNGMAQAVPVTIKTPAGSTVSDCYTVSPDFSPAEIAGLNSWVTNVYPNAAIVSDASRAYNCHGYAWHMTEGGSTAQVGYLFKTSEDIYMTDGSYIEVDPAIELSCATKVSYTPGNTYNHSAVTTSTPGVFLSKWGTYPLVRHNKDYCPYYDNGTVLKYYFRAPSTYQITGAPSLCTGSTTYSVNAYSVATITWSASPANVVSLQQNGNSVTITKLNSGVITLTATIADNCGKVTILNKTNIQIGGGNPPSLTLNYDNVCGKWFQALTYNEPVGVTGFNWTFTGFKNLTTSTSLTDANGGDLVLKPFLSGLTNGNTYTSYLKVQAVTSCGNSAYSSNYYVPVGPYSSGNCVPFQLLGINKGRVDLTGITIDDNPSNPSVFPNPVSNTFIVNIPAGKFNLSKTSIRVTSIMGKIIKTISTVSQTNSILSSNWATGVYIITITDGQSRITQKIIKM